MGDLPGRSLGPYQVLEQLGAGGMATVYKAYQPAMDRYVALKVLPQHLARDPGFRERFSREARTIARLEHRFILPVYDVGEVDSIPFLVMRYTTGGTLSDLIAAGPIPFARAVRLAEQIAEALAYAHSEGVIHRDIKPANVLLDRDGSPLLTDFGIAKIIAGSVPLTVEGALIGTPFYMAPEQAQGRPADARTDIYALGVVLYEMITGRRPYVAETPLAVALMHVHDPLPLPRTLNPDLPEPLERVILKALAKAPEDRFQTAGAMAEALRGVVLQLDAAATAPIAASPTVVLPESHAPASPPAESPLPTPAPAGPPPLPPSTPAPRPGQPRHMAPWLIGGGVLVLLAAGFLALRGAGAPGAAGPATAGVPVAGSPAASTPGTASTSVATGTAPGPTVTPRAGLRVFGAAGNVQQLVAAGDAIWLGTDGGLVRYGPDGQPRGFTTADGLPFNWTGTLVAAPDGTLWAGSYDRVAHITPAGDGLGAVTGYDYTHGLDLGNIRSLVVDPADGSIWAGGDNGVRRLSDGAWAQPDLPLEGVPTEATGPVVALLRDTGGAMWAAVGGYGLLRWDGERWSSYTADQGMGQAEYYRLLQARDGTLWAAVSEQGLLRFEPAAGRWAQVVPAPEGGFIIALAQLADGTLWLTTNDGVRQSDDAGASWTALAVPEGYLGTGEVAQAPDGRIWLGGASTYADGAWTKLTQKGLMPFSDVGQLVPAPDGRLWALEHYGGPAVTVDPRSQEVSVYPLEARVYAVAFSEGTTWLGTSDGIVRERGGARLNLTTDDGLPSNDVRELLATGGGLWIGTDKGLARYGFADEKIVSVPEFEGGIVEALLEAADGAVWAGSLREDEKGFGLLGRFDGERWELWSKGDLPNAEDAVEVTRLSADGEGRIWVLTWSSGLYRWDGEGWTTWTSQDGAPQSTLLAATARGDEVLIGGSLGANLFRWSEDGWSTLPVAGLSGDVEDIEVTEDGALWLATSDNLLRVAPE